jgi:predicted amidohydrolase
VRLIDLVVPIGTELIVFPELSVTGYEPTLAKDLATELDDRRFDVFQSISDAKRLTVGIGAPIKCREGICISLVLCQPRQARQLYSKMHLHADEESFFAAGPRATGLVGAGAKAALAICYELSVPEHAANAFENGADIYIASVAKHVGGIDNAITRLGEIACEYSMTVMMSNCIGQCDGGECAGKTSVWNNKGVLLTQLDDTREGVIVVDTETQDVVQHTIESNRH